MNELMAYLNCGAAAPLPNILADGQVAVFFAKPDDFSRAGVVNAFWGALSPDEKARHDRFHFEKDRQPYLVAHGVVRGALSLLASTEPASWSFAATKRGRPEIAGRPDLDLRFNLSHTGGLIAVAVGRKLDVGVDVERIERRGDIRGLIDYCLTDGEREQLPAKADSDARPVFCQFWTLKEAYLKARGLGIAIPLKKFGFKLNEGPEPRLECHPSLGENPAEWRFASGRPTAEHFYALAARAGQERHFEVLPRLLSPSDLAGVYRF